MTVLIVLRNLISRRPVHVQKTAVIIRNCIIDKILDIEGENVIVGTVFHENHRERQVHIRNKIIGVLHGVQILLIRIDVRHTDGKGICSSIQVRLTS